MLVGEVARGKALAVVVEAAKVIDTNGEPVELEDDEEAIETVEAADGSAEAVAEEAAKAAKAAKATEEKTEA